MTIGFSDDIDLEHPRDVLGSLSHSKSAGTAVERKIATKTRGVRVYCEVGPYRLRELAFI